MSENVGSKILSNSGLPLFPWKLHDLLEDAEKFEFDSILSWLPCGTRFKVHDSLQFETTIAPRYFNQHKYKSFQRQLNIYGFHQVKSRGRDKGAYFHSLFLRHKPSLCQYMVRTKIKQASRCKNETRCQELEVINARICMEGACECFSESIAFGRKELTCFAQGDESYVEEQSESEWEQWTEELDRLYRSHASLNLPFHR